MNTIRKRRSLTDIIIYYYICLRQEMKWRRRTVNKRSKSNIRCLKRTFKYSVMSRRFVNESDLTIGP